MPRARCQFATEMRDRLREPSPIAMSTANKENDVEAAKSSNVEDTVKPDKLVDDMPDSGPSRNSTLVKYNLDEKDTLVKETKFEPKLRSPSLKLASRSSRPLSTLTNCTECTETDFSETYARLHQSDNHNYLFPNAK